MRPNCILWNSFGQTFSWSTRLVQKNIYEEPLEICSLNPLTGWFRDGYCNTDEYDIGIHTVCGTMTEEFLEYTKNQGKTFLRPRKLISRKINKFSKFLGNDLSTPRGSFPGLKPGNRWALCAPRWLEAYRAGKAVGGIAVLQRSER